MSGGRLSVVMRARGNPIDDLFASREIAPAAEQAAERVAEALRREGIEGVPFFILDRRLSLSGAQSAAVIGAALLQALETGKPS